MSKIHAHSNTISSSIYKLLSLLLPPWVTFPPTTRNKVSEHAQITIMKRAQYTFGMFTEPSEHKNNDGFHDVNDLVMKTVDRAQGLIGRQMN